MQIKRFADAYAVCLEHLRARGVELDLINEGEAIQDVLLAVGKPYLTPHLAPLENSFTQTNSFWLVASKGDQVVCAAGVRFDDLGDEAISSFWTREVARYYRDADGPPQLVVDPIVDNLVPGGRVVYLGDLIASPGALAMAELQSFARAAQMLACMQWQPDMTCAFLSERHARQNAGMHYGFLSSALIIHQWIHPPYPRSNAEYFAYSTSAQLKLLASHIIAEKARKSNSEPKEAAPAPLPREAGERS